MQFHPLLAMYREFLKGSSQVVRNQVTKLRFVSFLRAGKRNFSTTQSHNLGRVFPVYSCIREFIKSLSQPGYFDIVSLSCPNYVLWCSLVSKYSV